MPKTIPFPTRFGSNAGQSFTRRDGAAKVTGKATFAADNHPDDMLYAVYVPATIARGRVISFDIAAAKAHPGVVEVMTPDNRPPLAGDPEVEELHVRLPLRSASEPRGSLRKPADRIDTR